MQNISMPVRPVGQPDGAEMDFDEKAAKRTAAPPAFLFSALARATILLPRILARRTKERSNFWTFKRAVVD
jgi:hypothetical protein